MGCSSQGAGGLTCGTWRVPLLPSLGIPQDVNDQRGKLVGVEAGQLLPSLETPRRTAFQGPSGQDGARGETAPPHPGRGCFLQRFWAFQTSPFWQPTHSPPYPFLTPEP